MSFGSSYDILRFMKKIILILFLTTFNCTYYFTRDNANHDLTKEELNSLKSKKIGLIGFYPFRYLTESVKKSEYLQFSPANGFTYRKDKGTENSNDLQIDNELYLQIIRFVNNNEQKQKILGEVKDSFVTYGHSVKSRTLNRTIAWFDLKKPTSRFLEFGQDLRYLEGNGINTQIEEDKLKIFLTEYLSKTKQLGLDVLEPLFSPSNDEKNPQMKNFDIDYWVIAYHAPLVLSLTDTFPQTSLSIIPHVFTGGIIPFFRKFQIDTRFFVFDRNLNHIKTYYCSDEIYTMTSWWVPFNKEDNIIYKPQLKEFSKRLVNFLN